MKTIEITEATDEQLREFANLTLGLSMPANTLRETVISKLSQAWDKTFIFESDPVLPQANAQEGDDPAPVTEDQELPEVKKVRIFINETEESGGREAVPVGCNGKVMLIPRGKNVDIPEPYYLILQNAITHKFDPLPDGGIDPNPRTVPLYPHQLVA